jgi:hypothetical protein
MNCQTFQNHVLSLPDPRQLPEPLTGHANSCAACTEWWRRAARLETVLAELPVPPAPRDKKGILLEELAGPVIASRPMVERRSLWSIPAVRTFSGIAAAVLIAVTGWMLVRPGSGTPIAKADPSRDPFLDRIVQRDLALAQARTADQRLGVLGSLADDLSGETRSLSKIASPEELRDLSDLFQKVVNDGIVEQARQLPEHSLTQTQKKELLDRLSNQLSEAGRQADDAAKESPPHAQPALRSISATARNGQAKLKTILGAKS